MKINNHRNIPNNILSIYNIILYQNYTTWTIQNVYNYYFQ